MSCFPRHIWVTLLTLTLSTAPNLFAYDNNSNGLSDIWEHLYDASDLQANEDEDGDGFSNGDESVSGTNPFDPKHKPALLARLESSDSGDLGLMFDTTLGKDYYLDVSNDLQLFQNLGPTSGWAGNGQTREIYFKQDATSETKSPIHCDFWANITGDTIESLTGLAAFPNNPDGTTFHSSPEAPQFLATGYGARVTAWITPPESGFYTFYLTAGGPTELHISLNPDSSGQTLIAQILPAQNDLDKLEWTTYETQRSEALNLEAGKKYFIELRYIATKSGQHGQIGWSGPGLDGIEQIDSDDLARTQVLAKYFPQISLLTYDYDTTGQTDLLWPNNTVIESGITGMSGNAERMTGDPGNSTAERIDFSTTSTEHLYATWLFNMSPGHDDAQLIFQNGTNDQQEGPRVNMEERSSGSLATVRAGGDFGGEVQINVTYDETYRVEIVSTLLEEGFEYYLPGGPITVEKDTFDIYVSNTNGNLIGSALGLPFRDSGAGVVQGFSGVRAAFVTNPNIAFDAWEVTSGQIRGSGFLTPNHIDLGESEWSNFFKLNVEDGDQDGDGILDWEELALSEFYEVLFFDSETFDGIADTVLVQALLQDATAGAPVISLYGTDAAAFESNYPNTIPDYGEITITREGTLAPISVDICIVPLVETGSTVTVCDGSCCMLIGSAGDEEAEIEDYELRDDKGNQITDSVEFAFGETTKVITLKAINDNINEYPETVNLAIKVADDGRYDISPTLNGASIQIFDLPDSPDNVAIFTGTFSQDGNAVIATSGSGFVTATINGPRTEMRFWNEFSNLTSNQQDSHVHKANPGNTPGDIIYAITNTPGDESGNPPGSDPLLGAISDYPWDLTESSGAVSTSGGGASKQVIIDSLFGQNGESLLYFNIHTVDNPAGEIWAFLNLSGGSASEPSAPPSGAEPGSAGYVQLTGTELDSEVRRFLNQATFGATDDAVEALVNKIETERLTNPDYHRNTAYSEWIDEQINPQVVEQTYLLDYTIAVHWQFMTLNGIFDPTLNPSSPEVSTPIRPTTWPTIDRSSSNPEYWYLDQPFPVSRAEEDLADDNDLNTIAGSAERRHAHWQTMLNASDQLRQKMGYALQQIVVVSSAASVIDNNAYGAVNYQDMLNTHAFSYYRDILGYVNWSPIMGKWLSSLQNQKAIDFDGDGLFDTYPDENLARENMQLFSIGLFQIWPDGSLKLSPEGLPQPTYTNDDIREFAKVLTGQSFSKYNDTYDGWGGSPYVGDNSNFTASQNSQGVFAQAYHYPMKMFGEYHSLGSKTFAGVTIDNSSITDSALLGEADIEAAIDWLAGKPGDGLPDFDMVSSHVSTPAFIARRLIQRFTTSNPSRDYLHRVATVFKDSEGHLGMTIKAILLDPEARQLDINNTTFGLKKSPLEGFMQLVRSLNAHTYVPLFDPQGAAPYDTASGDYSNPDLYLGTFDYPTQQLDNHERNVRFFMRNAESSGTRALQMNPFDQETVFNFYLPDFSPGGVVGNAGLVAPELQLANEPDIVRNINYLEDITRDDGISADELGGTNESQQAAFNSLDAERHDYTRLARQAMADAFYPAVEPTPINGRSSESLADEAMLDELDKRLTCGYFKMRYPYDPSDDDDPTVAGVDDLLKNPRELIIDAMTNGYDDAYNNNDDADDRIDKFSDALYLLTFSPEYQIRK